MPTLQTYPFFEVPDGIFLDCIRLWRRIWPHDDAPPDLQDDAETKRNDARKAGDRRRDEWVHCFFVDSQVTAIARSFLRTVAVDGTELTILALASVCCDPECRRHGYGATVVKSAFARLGKEASASLFQTCVPAFYERLGSRRIDAPVINSAGDGRAFWDPHVMVHPATANWPAGTIDLLGPGW